MERWPLTLEANVMLKAIGISSSCVTVSLCVCCSVSGVQQGLKWAWTKQQGNAAQRHLWKSWSDMFLCCYLKTTNQNSGQTIKTYCVVYVCVWKRSFNVICVWQSCGKTNTSPEAALCTVMEKTKFGADVELELLDWVPQSIRYMHWKTLQVHLWSMKQTGVLTNRAHICVHKWHPQIHKQQTSAITVLVTIKTVLVVSHFLPLIKTIYYN